MLSAECRMLPLRHTLAFAADQNAGHLMASLARLRHSTIRPVPTRMIRIVPGGSAFPRTALSAGRAVQNRLMRTSCPVFVNVEFGSRHRRGRGPGNQSRVGYNLLQL